MVDPLWNPQALRSLREVADSMAPAAVVVVGAAALLHHRPGRFRITLDIDLAVAVDPRGDRLPDGWTRAQPPRQRWSDRDGRPIDIVPATPHCLERGFVEWQDGTRMSLIGFDLVMRDSVPLSADGPANLRVADLMALSVCKIVAWTDRPGDRQKDLRDLATILETYVEPDHDRFHDEPDPALEFEARAPFLLGIDLARRGSSQHAGAVLGFIERMSETDGRVATAFLSEAQSVGNWNDRLFALRFDALRCAAVSDGSPESAGSAPMTDRSDRSVHAHAEGRPVLVGTLGAQFGGVAEAVEGGDRAHSGGLAGAQVLNAVADHRGVGRVVTDDLERRVQRDCRRFALVRRVAADQRVDREVQVLEDAPCEALGLVGHDGDRDACRAPGREPLAHQGVEPHQARALLGVVGLVAGPDRIDRWGGGQLTEGPLDQLAGAVADQSTHLRRSERSQAEVGAQMVDAGSDVGERVDERAVEVEEHRANRHDGARWDHERSVGRI